MNYLIFGGSGFIGTHLINLIKENNSNNIIYNLDIVENNHNGKSNFKYCDIRNKIKLDIEATGNDIIFNLAAVHRTPGHPDYDYFDANINGAENICNYASFNNISKIVFTSSIAPYGAAENLKTEETLPTPNTPYGISKLVAEKIHQIWQSSDKNRSLVILRPGVVFGKGENGNFTRLYKSIDKKMFFYPGRKDTIKASIYVKDLVRFGLERIADSPSGTCELFNCTYEPAFSIQQIVETISKVTNKKAPTLLVNAKLMLITARVASLLGAHRLGIHPDRVKKLMISTNICGTKLANSGYTFKYTLEEAICDWYADNNNKCLE
ncbi:UDP-N-acetylglucosamine 4-epimerase [Bacteroidia bacterium]|nr:UDP-N-acetylglucosamine 4-epimerase [Bacteroidia bacterium]